MLNTLQKQIIDETVKYMLDDIINDGITTHNKAKILNSLLNGKLEYLNLGFQEKLGIAASIRQLVNILFHPCPQNRNDSYPYVGKEKGFSMFRLEKNKIEKINDEGDVILKNGRIIPKSHVVRNSEHDDYIIAKEKEGLLNLTGWEDDQTEPVSRNDVIEYVRQIIQEKKLEICPKTILDIMAPHRVYFFLTRQNISAQQLIQLHNTNKNKFTATTSSLSYYAMSIYKVSMFKINQKYDESPDKFNEFVRIHTSRDRNSDDKDLEKEFVNFVRN